MLAAAKQQACNAPVMLLMPCLAEVLLWQAVQRGIIPIPSLLVHLCSLMFSAKRLSNAYCQRHNSNTATKYGLQLPRQHEPQASTLSCATTHRPHCSCKLPRLQPLLDDLCGHTCEGRCCACCCSCHHGAQPVLLLVCVFVHPMLHWLIEGHEDS